MTPFRREGDELLVDLSPTERVLLTRLATDLQELLRDAQGTERRGENDPAVARLLPDAYPDDAEASAEFRRFTESELLDGKIAQQRTIARLFGDEGGAPVVLTEPDALAFLRGLTDLRLVLAERLGIREDGDDGATDDEEDFTANLYAWLGYLQGCLVDTLDG